MIVGMKKIMIKLPNGHQWVLKEARHILDLKSKIISISNLDGEDYIVAFSNHAWKVTKCSIVVVSGNMVGILYFLTNTSNYTINLASIDEDVIMWHHMLGYMKEKDMKTLHTRKLLPKLKQLDLRFYEDCIYRNKKIENSQG